jgi:adenylosuccinate synthase
MHTPKEGTADVVIGLQHGDEGKGRFIDNLAERYDWIVRYNGGANAGHTVEVPGKQGRTVKLALHQVPSGVAHPKARLYIASQCVVNLPKLLAEIEEIEGAGLDVRSRLRLSSMASIVQPAHIVRDAASMKESVGTTGNGIGPAYADQAARIDGNRRLDLRLGDLLEDPEGTFDAIRVNYLHECMRWGINAEDQVRQLDPMRRAFEALRHCIDPDPTLLVKELRRGMRVLFEGAQAVGLDKTYGATPNVTASNTGVQAAFLSGGVPVDFKGTSFGVAKLIPSRVGWGAFVSEYGGRRSE